MNLTDTVGDPSYFNTHLILSLEFRYKEYVPIGLDNYRIIELAHNQIGTTRRTETKLAQSSMNKFLDYIRKEYIN